MMSFNNDSKLFICSDYSSINFSSLEKLSVFCGLGPLRMVPMDIQIISISLYCLGIGD